MPDSPFTSPTRTPAQPDEIPWNTRGFRPLAGIASLALPGLGHVLLGLPKRGALIALGVLGLVALGVLVGGLDAVDSRDDRWWFIAQAPVGPVVFALDTLHQSLRESHEVVQGLGRMNEIGMLSIALAGMMNLIAAIDALFPPIRRRSEGAKL